MSSSSSWKSLSDIDLYWRLSIAVYGTLRTGLGNHRRFLADNSAVLSMTLATVKGYELHAYSPGLPVVIPRGDASIVVEIVTIDDSREGDLLRDQLDSLEGFRPHFPGPTGLYNRVLTKAVTADGQHVECWLYAAGSAVTIGDLGEPTRVAGGDWCQR